MRMYAYIISRQDNRLYITRGKSGHQTRDVPFDKIRAGNSCKWLLTASVTENNRLCENRGMGENGW